MLEVANWWPSTTSFVVLLETRGVPLTGFSYVVQMSSMKNSLWFKVKYDQRRGEGVVDDLENLRVKVVSASAVRKGMARGSFELGQFLCWVE